MPLFDIGEIAPTAGLDPHAGDLLARKHEATLEEAICTQLGLPDIEIVASARAAILIALTHLKSQSPHRRRVIITAYTCPIVVYAIAAAGLEIEACDTVAGGFDLDLEHLRRLLSDDTLAVMPTHYGGALTDVARVRAVATAISPGVAIVEDAAQAFGAKWQGRSVGLCGDIGIFSFGVGKGFTIYEGGALVAADARVLLELRKLAAALTRRSAWAEAWRALMLVGYHAVYNPLGLRAVYGLPKRYWLARCDEVRAANDDGPRAIDVRPVGAWRKAVGHSALARLPAHLADCRRRFARLAQQVSAIAGLKVHLPGNGAEPSATFLFVTLPQTPAAQASIQQLWWSQHGACKLFSKAIVDYPTVQPLLLLRSDTPNARALAATTITLSTHAAFGPEAEAAVLALMRVASLPAARLGG